MTDLTSRELFDAIERSLRRTGRRFARPVTAAKAPARAAKTRAPSKKSKQRTVRRKARAGESSA